MPEILPKRLFVFVQMPRTKVKKSYIFSLKSFCFLLFFNNDNYHDGDHPDDDELFFEMSEQQKCASNICSQSLTGVRHPLKPITHRRQNLNLRKM